MTKTYVASVPDHIGAFLQASKCFANLGINVTRVSYNKAVDSHTIFLDVEGTAEQLAAADKDMAEIGYLQDRSEGSNVILVEFQLRDEPGGMNTILELIAEFSFSISYMSSQPDNDGNQLFKIGLLITDEERIKDFLHQAEQLCPVRIIDYNRSERSFDNSIFYSSFVNSLIKASGISPDTRNELLVYTNLAMHNLDERGLDPHRTFDTISKFAEMLANCRGTAFSPRITHHEITEQTEIIVIEPPCGSNTTIIHSGDEYFFIDCGYAYYRDEMMLILRQLIPNFDDIKKRVLITHADLDHCGLLFVFDEILASTRSAECFRLEHETGDGFREHIHIQKPYIEICKILTEYAPPDMSKVTMPWPETIPEHSLMQQAGVLNVGDLTFDVYETRGGHLPGELILIDYEHHIAFTGDIYINIKGLTSEQRQYNHYAPILTTSVDTDKKLCADERKAIFNRLGAGKWRIFGGHGICAEYDPSEK